MLSILTLGELSPTFRGMYSDLGRPSVPPGHLLKGSLLIAPCSIRSERQFCEHLQYDLLFKWFLDLNIEDRAFDPSTFSKNRRRLMEHEVARRSSRRRGDGDSCRQTASPWTVHCWSPMKSLRPREGGDGLPRGGGKNPTVDFRGEHRSNVTHVSTTDLEARLARKGSDWEARLAFAGHVLMKNRNGLVVDVTITGRREGWSGRRPSRCCTGCQGDTG